MLWYNLVIYLLACVGTTFILAYGSIFDPIRPKNKFFKCPLCLGFWVGLSWYGYFHAAGIELLQEPLLGFVVFPFVSAIVCYWGANIIGDDGINVNR